MTVPSGLLDFRLLFLEDFLERPSALLQFVSATTRELLEGPFTNLLLPVEPESGISSVVETTATAPGELTACLAACDMAINRAAHCVCPLRTVLSLSCSSSDKSLRISAYKRILQDMLNRFCH